MVSNNVDPKPITAHKKEFKIKDPKKRRSVQILI